MSSVLLPVSIGEGLDKLSILRIKQKYILDPQKQDAVTRELNAIYPKLEQFIGKVPQQFTLLEKVNETIWHLCDVARKKDMTTDQVVMKYNDARFRIKKKINILCDSYLQEQKSFDGTSIKLHFTPELTVDDVRDASIHYDTVYLVGDWTASIVGELKDDPWIVVS